MRRFTAPIVLILLLVALPASAGKIGFVDAERAVAEVDEGKVGLAEIQAWQAPHQTKLDQLRDQYLALREQIVAQQETATEEALAEIEKNQIEALRKFEDARRDYERELEERKTAVLARITPRIGTIASEYAKANDYDAVFILGAQPVIYVAETSNLTDTVIEIYNQRFPVSGQ
jgi:Skp family chaperone for outer membrane proteins